MGLVWTSVSFVEIHDRFQNSSFCKKLCDYEAETLTRVLDQIKTLNNMICCAFGNVYHSWSGISEKWSLEETKKCNASLDGELE